MKQFSFDLSCDEFYLVLSCLSSCGAQCFSSGNVELGKRYAELHAKLENLFLCALRD